MNQNGILSREEPFSFFSLAVQSATAVYGSAANAKAVDALLMLVSATFTATDQAGNSVVFPAFPAGTVIPISPANITAMTASSIALLYK